LEERIRSNTDDPIMGEHLGKYRSLLPSLALIFHLIEVADEKATGAVTLHSPERAAQWCEYLETHAKRIYGLVGDIATQADDAHRIFDPDGANATFAPRSGLIGS
jgi:Protein of unknown function (DUF3987)